jgi:AraC-like DNA-binding protein
MLLGREPVAAQGEAALDAYQVRLIALGVVPLADGFASDSPGPTPWTLSVCAAAGATLHLGARVIALPPGRVVLIPPAAARAKTDGDVTQLRLQFQPSASASEPAAALGTQPLVLGPDELRDTLSARLRRDLEAGRTLGAATCARAKALVHLSVAAAFELGVSAPHESQHSDDVERQLRPVLRFIDAHLGEPLENARLAAFVHASESHFIRMFRRVVGCTPARHVQERRVSHAAELLARTHLTIDEIAERCGFANRFHFSRVFAQRMIEPPGRYRALHGARTESAAGSAT